MRRSALLILGLTAILLSPNVVLSTCLPLGLWGPVNWYVQNERTIIFYDSYRTTPIAEVTLQTCRVNDASTILLSKRYLCDSDKIIVDNRPCSIMTITSASGPSF
jgi:hypothetical protein